MDYLVASAEESPHSELAASSRAICGVLEFNRRVDVLGQVSWSVDGRFLPPEQLWEDAQVGFEQQQRRIWFWLDDQAGKGHVGAGREAGEAVWRRQRGEMPGRFFSAEGN